MSLWTIENNQSGKKLQVPTMLSQRGFAKIFLTEERGGICSICRRDRIKCPCNTSALAPQKAPSTDQLPAHKPHIWCHESVLCGQAPP
ncbi:hypothetical protein EK904_000656 [Melospiza melodia maxima]|nr:hypothetical protein EK904_000656 [Melospiza melodia maxima]